MADGLPDFGGKGAWYPGFSGNIAETKWKGVKSADVKVDVPFLPWPSNLFNERVTSNSEGRSGSSMPAGGVPRYMFDPYAFEMVQTPDQVIFLFEGDNYLGGPLPRRESGASEGRESTGWGTRRDVTRRTRWWST